MKKSIVLTIIIWTVLITTSFSWNYFQLITEQKSLAFHAAKSFFQQIVITRLWNTSHGGVYVPITEKTKPNPYLVDPLRDLECNGNLRLTKINPAYMTRQLSEIAARQAGVQFHITSLKPLRPENAPSERETKALRSFENGKSEVGRFIRENNSSLFFYMAPLLTEKPCLKCHAAQGYTEGSIRGGISVILPFQHGTLPSGLFLTHLGIFIAGVAFILIFGTKLITAYNIIKTQAAIDALTGIPNRRFFTEELLKQFRGAKRESCPLTIVMCDVDYFKLYNDTYGHKKGDECLKKIAETLEKSMGRPNDFCARYGGEEFVVILPNTSCSGGFHLAERILRDIQDLRIEHLKSKVANVVTVSLGVATMAADTPISHEELVNQADKALYMAKEKGRNCIHVAPIAE